MPLQIEEERKETKISGNKTKEQNPLISQLGQIQSHSEGLKREENQRGSHESDTRQQEAQFH